jgi:hypothetical protein
MLAEQAAQCALKGLLHGMGASRDAYGHGLVRLAERAADQVEADPVSSTGAGSSDSRKPRSNASTRLLSSFMA